MKEIKYIAIGVLTLACSLSAYAQIPNGSVNLKVIGKISPASCTMVLGATSGNLDFGHIDYNNVDSNELYIGSANYPAKTLSGLTVNCDSPTLIGISTTDNRKSSVLNMNISNGRSYNQDGEVINNIEPYLGLGTDAKGVAIGGYTADFIHLKVDGNTSRFSDCMAQDSETAKVASYASANDCPAGQVRKVLDTSGNIISGKVFTWDYIVSPMLNTPDNLDPAGWSMDGSVTLQVVYL
ncbi:Protein of uncharacterised function (DUF1120) [Buttiauxella agrestis]|uniref:Protein of uncharacterized function (DUF1120) n=1 Tax=Buttiauxella agrestis TaxID=82977 RepID=A0A381KNK1_9ENTR|nr:DUF1120 domain-containing protein [Buttiauxella agrestis]SUY92954.1 Protein of uncharacterised function (DUF1120) [Buttiauxella agrestis]